MTAPVRPSSLIDPERLHASVTAALVLDELPAEIRACLENIDAVALLRFAEALNPSHRQRARLMVRDRAIAKLAGNGFSATDIAAQMASYAGNGWRRDQFVDTCPARYVGRPSELFWLAFKAWPQPLTRQRISQIIENIQGTRKSDPSSDLHRSG